MSKNIPPTNGDTPEKHRKKHKHGTEEEDKKRKRKRRDLDDAQSLEPSPTKKSKSGKKATKEVSTLNADDSVSHSPFYIQRASLYLPIPPIALSYATQGICSEVLSSLILKYYPPLQGVVTAYANVQLSEQLNGAATEGPILAKSVNEYAVSFIWATADFLLFRPRRGDSVSGWISLQNEGHISLICWNLFNASIARSQLSTAWKWIEPVSRRPKSKAKLKGGDSQSSLDKSQGSNGTKDSQESFDYQGHYEDQDGTLISGVISFTVEDIEASSSTDRERSYLMIEGTMRADRERQEEGGLGDH